MSTSSQNPDRDAYIAGLRQLADWLEQRPGAPVPSADRLLVPLMTNAAVEEFATSHGFTAELDKDGNASVSVPFGPITFHVYGYADWPAWSEQLAEKRARNWADSKGMTIQPREEESTSKEPFPSRGGHDATCAYVSGMTTRCTCSAGGAR